jgi:hypothetical protein
MSRQKSRLYIPKSFNQFQPLDGADLARTADDDRLPFNVFHQVRDGLILEAQLFQAILYDVPNVAKIKSQENFQVRKETFSCGTKSWGS